MHVCDGVRRTQTHWGSKESSECEISPTPLTNGNNRTHIQTAANVPSVKDPLYIYKWILDALPIAIF